jgi:hypothetical protein
MNMKMPITVAGLALAAAAVVAPVATAAPSAAATCQLYAEQPYYNGSINGWGHWYNCPTNAKVTVVLRHDKRWWPDSTLDSETGTGSSGSRLTVYPCGNRFDPIKVFVEVRYGSQKVQSPRAILPCA